MQIGTIVDSTMTGGSLHFLVKIDGSPQQVFAPYSEISLLDPITEFRIAFTRRALGKLGYL